MTHVYKPKGLTVLTLRDRDATLKLQILDWEIYNGGILLCEVAIVDESLHM